MAALALFAASCGGDGSDAGNVNSAAEAPPQNLSEITDPLAALAEGNRLLEANLTEQAIDAYRRAVELDPNLAEAWFRMGIAYALIEAEMELRAEAEPTATPLPGEERPKEEQRESEKAFEKAVEAYKKIIEANPDDHSAHYNLGRSYNKLNKDEEAAKALRQAVKLNPDDTEYQAELGAILIKLAKYPEAVTALKKAVDLDPTNSRAVDLLERAEAGKARIDYVTIKKDEKKPSGDQANANSNSAVPDTPDSNSAPKPKPTEKPRTMPANRP